MLTTELPAEPGLLTAVTNMPNHSSDVVPRNSLSTFLAPDAARPSLSSVLTWADSLLASVQQLHSDVIPTIHGSIDPSNVLLDGDNVSLTEVGKGPEMPANYKPLEQIFRNLDRHSQRVIIDRYDASGEGWLTKPLVPATDLYAVGATIYALLTGTTPPDAVDRAIAAIEGKPDPLVDPTQLNAEIPSEISVVLVKAMALRPEDRYYSSVIFRQVLKTAAIKVAERLASPPATAPVEAMTGRRRTDVQEENAVQRSNTVLADKAVPARVEPPVPAPTAPSETEDSILDLPAAPAPRETISKEYPKFELSAVEKSDNAKSGYGLIAAFAGGAVVLAGVVFGVYSFTRPSSPPLVAPLPSAETRLSAEPAQQPGIEVNTQTATSNIEAAVPSDSTVTPAAETERTSKPRLNAAAEPPKKPAPSPAQPKAQPTKKQLTVDDLINDK